MLAASAASTIAGWHSAAALKGVPALEERETTLPPQHSWMLLVCGRWLVGK
jgi:hypothetical protein